MLPFGVSVNSAKDVQSEMFFVVSCCEEAETCCSVVDDEICEACLEPVVSLLPLSVLVELLDEEEACRRTCLCCPEC